MTADLRDQLQQTLGATHVIERELTGGGMSRVFVAEESRLKRKVVVKVLSPEMAAGLSAERFEREIQLAASLQQANIVPLLTAGDAGGLPYFTMPFVEGESLRTRLANGGGLPITEVVSILRDVARALAYAHQRGVVHRDIKPDNVLLSGGTAVVTDFGIAKAIEAAGAGRAVSGTGTLTQLGTSLGTPAYMAPEQAAADPATDHRADLYAFGCMGYELLAGQPPFHGRTPQKLLAAHMGERPRPISELRPDVPSALAALVMLCLEKDPDDRPQSAREIVAVLDSMSTTTAANSKSSAVLLHGRMSLGRALATYAAACIAVTLLAWAAVLVIGLPDWFFPGTLALMALGLPAILITAYVHRTAYRALVATPTVTPGGTNQAHGTLATLALRASPHVSWRRTSAIGVTVIGAFVLYVGVFMLLRALGIGPAGSLLAAGKVSAKEPLLLTDFRVVSADSSIASVVAEAVRTGLGESRAITLVPATNVAQALQRMQLPPGLRIDTSVARQVAAREGIKGIVDGQIQGIAGSYIVTLRLLAADSGTELASFHRQMAGADLLAGVDALTRDLRKRIGESLKSVQATPPLERVTTTSLPALRAYSEGVKAFGRADMTRAIPLLQQAVADDSTFAMAWRKLGAAYANSGYSSAQIDSVLERAYHFRDHLTDQERELATANYYEDGPGADRAKAIAAYEVLVAGGDSEVAANNLGNLLRSRREFAKAETLHRATIRANPAALNGYTNVMNDLVDEGRIAAAESTFRSMGQHTGPSIVDAEYEIQWAYLTGDYGAARRGADSVALDSDPNVRQAGIGTRAIIDLVQGRYTSAMVGIRELDSLNHARGIPVYVIADSTAAAMGEALMLERPDRASAALDAAMVGNPLRVIPIVDRPDLPVAQAYAAAGRPERATSIVAQWVADIRDTAFLRASQPAYHTTLGEIALANGKPLDALREFRKGDSLPDGPATECAVCLYQRLGRAFDRGNMPDSAIIMYERYVSTPEPDRIGTLDGFLLTPTMRRLGELYEAKGNRAKAAEYYQKFLDLWKGADATLQPQVAEVRKRLAHLKDPEGG